MNWPELALKNSVRRPLRALVTAAGVAIAVAGFFSLMAFQRGYQEGIRGELDHLGAHVLVVPKGCPYDSASIALHGARWPCYLKSSYLQEVREQPGVGTAAPAFMNALYEEDGRQSVYVGVEENIVALKPGWRITGSFPAANGEMLVGSDVAEKRSWKTGQAVTLPGLPGKRGKVAGVLAPTGGPDDTFIYLRLPDAQRLFGHRDQLTHILVRLSDPNQLDHAVSALRGCSAGLDMNVVPLAHLFRTIRDLVNSTRLLLGSVVLVAFFVAGTGVSNTLLIAVSERTGEIGTMRALGASRFQVFRLFWLEAVQVCLGAGVVGILGAFAAASVIEGWLRSQLPFSPTEPLIRWEWWVAGLCLVGCMVLGSLASLLPAWRATRLTPMEAIRWQG